MKDTKRSILIITIAGIVALLIGAAAYTMGLGALLPKEGAFAALIGTTPIGFGMKCCLIAVLGVVFLVPSIRSQFTGSYSSGSNYKSAHKKGHSRI